MLCVWVLLCCWWLVHLVCACDDIVCYVLCVVVVDEMYGMLWYVIVCVCGDYVMVCDYVLWYIMLCVCCVSCVVI